MRYGARLNTGLAVMLALLVAVVLLLDDDEATATPAVLDVEFNEVRTMRIESGDRPALAFERAGDGWRMLSPLVLDADLGRLQNIIAGLNVAAHASYPVTETDLVALELEPPRARLVIDDMAFEFGDTSPADGRRYLRQGDTIHLVDDLVYFRLGGTVHSWARRQPLPPGSRITRIETAEFVIVRDGDEWSLAGGMAADADDLQRVVDAWANALAAEVAATDPERADGIDVAITLDDGPTIGFRLYRTDVHMVVARSDAGIEYRLPLFRSEELHTLPTNPD